MLTLYLCVLNTTAVQTAIKLERIVRLSFASLGFAPCVVDSWNNTSLDVYLQVWLQWWQLVTIACPVADMNSVSFSVKILLCMCWFLFRVFCLRYRTSDPLPYFHFPFHFCVAPVSPSDFTQIILPFEIELSCPSDKAKNTFPEFLGSFKTSRVFHIHCSHDSAFFPWSRAFFAFVSFLIRI